MTEPLNGVQGAPVPGPPVQGPAEDLIPAAEAVKMIPSNVPGKRLNLATLHRWILAGRIPGAVRRGRWYFIPRAEVERLARGEPVVAAPPAERGWRRKQMSAAHLRAEEELRKMGVL